MAEQSDFKKAMQEYKGHVSGVKVRDISPSKLEGVFEGTVSQNNIFFEQGQLIKFKYFSQTSGAHELILSRSMLRYPVSLGVAHVDASSLKRRVVTY